MRLQTGDIVFFDVDMNSNISEVSFSAIWRGRVEDKDGNPARTYDFFANIDKELLPFNPQRQTVSLAERVFGFVEEKEKQEEANHALAYKGRVRFSDAMTPDTNCLEEMVPLKILNSPKLPCPLIYFGNNGNIDKSELSPEQHQPQGRTLYLHTSSEQEPYWISSSEERKHLKTQIRPVKAGTSFYFTISFDNLEAEELGMLLYALRPDGNFRHKIGMAKPLGLGSVRIDPLGLFTVDRRKRYTSNGFSSGRYHRITPFDQALLNRKTNTETAAESFGSLGDIGSDVFGQLTTLGNFDQEDSPPDIFSELDKLEQLAYIDKPGKVFLPVQDAVKALAALNNKDKYDYFSDTCFEDFAKSVDADIRRALELLGDPDKISHDVMYPPSENGNLEDKLFEWFEDKNSGALPGITKNSKGVPWLKKMN